MRYTYRRAPIRRTRKGPPYPGAWGVMIIDSAPIRKQAKRDYERVLRDLDEAKGEIERFHSEDKPKYRSWMSQNFGAVLTELRELEQKL